MAKKDLEEHGDAGDEAGLLKVCHLLDGPPGSRLTHNFGDDNEGWNGDGQPLQTKKEKLTGGRTFIEAVSEVPVQFG